MYTGSTRTFDQTQKCRTPYGTQYGHSLGSTAYTSWSSPLAGSYRKCAGSGSDEASAVPFDARPSDSSDRDTKPALDGVDVPEPFALRDARPVGSRFAMGVGEGREVGAGQGNRALTR